MSSVSVSLPAQFLSRFLSVFVAFLLIVAGATTASADTAPDDEPEASSTEVDADSDAAVTAAVGLGSVSGLVRLASGQSPAGTRVSVFDAETGEQEAEVELNDSSYHLTLSFGSYVIHYAPAPGSNALDSYYSAAATWQDATVVNVGSDVSLAEVVLGMSSVAAGTASISGAAEVGSTLRVHTSGWRPQGVSLSYQWLRNAHPIPGATASTYAVGSGDAHASLQVLITGTAPGLDSASVTTEAVTINAGTLKAGTVRVTGTTRVGSLLTGTTSGWPSSTTLQYQWQRNGTPISGATGRTYRLTAADRDASVRVQVRASATGFTTASRTSSAVRVSAGVLSGATPRISGPVRVGGKLTATTGAWTNKTTLRYQWFVDGKAVSGQTKSTFTLRASDRGKRITVRVTGSLSGYTTATRTSTRTSAVAAGVFKTAPKPRITGTPRTGQTLRVSTGSWSPSARFSYQWRVDGKAVRGATKSTFKVRASDRGKRITVRVTARRDGYTATNRTSAATARVQAPFTKVTRPKVSGTVRVGSTLSAQPGSWSPSASFKYQWYANGKAISGATGRTLKLTSAHFGQRITVKVSGSRSTYVSTSRTSVQTAAVAAPRPSITRDGTYQVGSGSSRIAPGTYVTTAPAGCYWERRSSSGSSFSGIIANDYVSQRGQVIVTITKSDKFFVSNGCGSWTRMMPRGKQVTSFGTGQYAVGIHVRPGTYRTSGAAGCYWEIASDHTGSFSAIVDNEFTSNRSQQNVTIRAGQAFTSDGCGTWRRT